MKNTIKRGVSILLLMFGIMSLTGCISYTRHDTDYAYRDPYYYGYYSYGHYADNGPRHPDWNYD